MSLEMKFSCLLGNCIFLESKTILVEFRMIEDFEWKVSFSQCKLKIKLYLNIIKYILNCFFFFVNLFYKVLHVDWEDRLQIFIK